MKLHYFEGVQTAHFWLKLAEGRNDALAAELYQRILDQAIQSYLNCPEDL